ncbi:HU domain-containing protein [Porphyromonas sp.]
MNSRLAEQISYLLLRHEYVVVPQLGGFIREQLPASYDRVKHLAYPPSAELHFNAEMTHSDGLLEERYALLLGLSLRRARLVLEDEVSQLRHQLIQQGSYHLVGIGEMHLTREGQLTFTPDTSAPATSASAYGYSPLSLPALPQVVRHQGLNSNDSRYISLRLSKRALGYAAVIIIALLALLPWGNKVETEQHYQAGFTPSTEVARQLFGDAPKKAEPTPQATMPKQGEIQWSTEQDGRYYIVIATERTEERITAYATQTRSTLPEATLTALRSPRGRTIRLALTSFDTSAEAYTYLNKLVKESPAHRSAWVFHNN